ncbi:uncharacterized protein LY79DRAFT_411058 [Colletotrichum navitas]|uniref:Uncharacterized protein n=1 Tax=Colletotrichum navitas TaxID=681940 RepID=A0AAD8PNN9_9PEZI|nr:uncharacterized protein LY79DRAFT_411058 [Colletotrichum navitas]KAK1573487.1 hypothetical protein LY79DRAFT_411058 [Colletotrichum navitas]
MLLTIHRRLLRMGPCCCAAARLSSPTTSESPFRMLLNTATRFRTCRCARLGPSCVPKSSDMSRRRPANISASQVHSAPRVHDASRCSRIASSSLVGASINSRRSLDTRLKTYRANLTTLSTYALSALSMSSSVVATLSYNVCQDGHPSSPPPPCMTCISPEKASWMTEFATSPRWWW